MYGGIQQNDVMDKAHLYGIFLVGNEVLLIIFICPNISGWFSNLPSSKFFSKH